MFAMVNTKKNLTLQQKRSRAAVDYSSCICKSGDEAARGSLPAQSPHSDQVISCGTRRRPSTGRAPDPGLKKSIWFFKNGTGWCVRHDPSFKPQASSVKDHAPIFRKIKVFTTPNCVPLYPSTQYIYPSPGPWSGVLEYLFNVQGITDHGA